MGRDNILGNGCPHTPSWRHNWLYPNTISSTCHTAIHRLVLEGFSSITPIVFSKLRTNGLAFLLKTAYVFYNFSAEIILSVFDRLTANNDVSSSNEKDPSSWS